MEIESGRPFVPPHEARGQKRKVILALKNGNVGDSFAIPYPSDERQALRLRNCYCTLATYHGIKLASRKLVEGSHVLRFWRIV